MKKALVFDGYVDEPSCFGVPPYVSPYVRYAFGLLSSQGFEVSYITMDRWRQEYPLELWLEADCIVLVTGFTVPGRYRGGTPPLLQELETLVTLPRKGLLFAGGPLVFGFSLQGGKLPDEVAVLARHSDCFTQDPVASLGAYSKTGALCLDAVRTYQEIREWALKGAALLPQHPSFPEIIVELELSEGCNRTSGHCSFCTEGQFNSYKERPVADVLEEVQALASHGALAFRLGKCSDILSYGGKDTLWGKEPSAHILERLYGGIRKACPEIQVLHTDNCNPSTIAHFPEQSRKALRVISQYNTEGDSLSLGIENLDPQVHSINNLKVSARDALMAIRIINEEGGLRERARGLPKLLPGLNFLLGLPGERTESFEYNAEFLRLLVREHLIVRRINIRKVIPFKRTSLAKLFTTYPARAKSRKMRTWKEWVRKEIDPLMFQRYAPLGTILKNIILEERSGHCIFGRALGSYPPLVGVMDDSLKEGEIIDVAVTDYGSRSLTGVPFPLSLKGCSRTNLLALPHIGKPRADRIMEKRQEKNFSLEQALDDPEVAKMIDRYFA